MIGGGATARVTEAELARDLHSILDRVRLGAEIVIEQNDQTIAVLKPPQVKGRLISEVIADLEARRSNAVIKDFARDVEEGIKAHQQPWNPPSWISSRFQRFSYCRAGKLSTPQAIKSIRKLIGDVPIVIAR